MKPTARGLAAVFLAVALFSASVAFRDPFIGASLLVASLVILSEAAWVGLVTRKPEGRFAVSPESQEHAGASVVLYPGDESTTKVLLTKKVGGRAELSSTINFLEIVPARVEGAGQFPIEFRLRTEYAGEYSGTSLGLAVTGPLGLFSSKASIPFARRYVVYPKVMKAAAAAVRLIGRGGIGEAPVEVPGVGTEYYEMREYHPGDDVRDVNWKASARMGELTVVEHMRESGSAFLLMLDTRAPGFRETDELASAFLSFANSMASSQIEFGLIVHDGRRVTGLTSQSNTRANLVSALKAAMEMTRLETSPEFLELVPLAVRNRLDSNALLPGLNDVGRAELRSVIGSKDPWSTAARYVRETQTENVVYVSGLYGAVQPLIGLAWESRHYRDAEFTVVNPCDDGSDDALRRYQKPARALNEAGVVYSRGRVRSRGARSLAPTVP